MKKYMFEIYPTCQYVQPKIWLDLILKICKIDGLFKTWNLWINIEKNYIRYFIEIDRMLPPILSDLGDFLIKKVDISLKEKYHMSVPYFLTNNYKTILDLYDKFETRKGKKIHNIKIKFFVHKYNSYLSTTNIFIKSTKNIKKRVFWNFSIFEFLSIDFNTHIRFFYHKNEEKYLDAKKVINVLNTHKENAILQADVFPYLQDDLYLNYSSYDFAKHSVIIGASGTGKSKLICSMIKNLSNNQYNKLKYKIIIIDPHSSMENDIGGLDDTTVIDFKTNENSINLFCNTSNDIISEVESIMSILKNIIADRYNSKLERVLRYSIHVLLEVEKFNLMNLRKLLIETDYRNKILIEAQNIIKPNIIEFFKVDFNELRTKSYQEAISPIISFIDEMQLLPAIGEDNNLSYLKDVIKNNFITILSLDQIVLGLNITKTIAGFAMQQILQLVQSHTFDEHIIFVIDEVAVVENPILGRFLSEARKYNLSLILAGQYFAQISEELQKSIFTNVINYFIFRVSRLDATILEKNMQMEVAVRNSVLIRLKMLSELNDRECIARISKDGRLLTAFKGKTLDFVAMPRVKKKIENKKEIINHTKEVKIKFSINTENSLEDIMKKQSTSRKRIGLGDF